MKPSREAKLFHPELLRFMDTAKGVPEAIQSRSLHVQSADNTEFISYSFAGSARGEILWHDNEKRAWREGRPKMGS